MSWLPVQSGRENSLLRQPVLHCWRYRGPWVLSISQPAFRPHHWKSLGHFPASLSYWCIVKVILLLFFCLLSPNGHSLAVIDSAQEQFWYLPTLPAEKLDGGVLCLWVPSVTYSCLDLGYPEECPFSHFLSLSQAGIQSGWLVRPPFGPLLRSPREERSHVCPALAAGLPGTVAAAPVVGKGLWPFTCAVSPPEMCTWPFLFVLLVLLTRAFPWSPGWPIVFKGIVGSQCFLQSCKRNLLSHF